jgi:hypothetical protein
MAGHENGNGLIATLQAQWREKAEAAVSAAMDAGGRAGSSRPIAIRAGER